MTKNLKAPLRLGQFELGITFTGRLPSWARTPKLAEVYPEGRNKLLFTEKAFQPKIFTVRLEKGNYILPWVIDRNPTKIDKSTVYNTRYARRLMFDASPYPPKVEMKKTYDYQSWTQEFVAHHSNLLNKTTRAMNERSIHGALDSSYHVTRSIGNGIGMNQALSSILCKEKRWMHDSEDGGHYIKFNSDQTGEVLTPVMTCILTNLT
jgi:hypothetical protein